MKVDFETHLMGTMKRANNPSGLPDLHKHVHLKDPDTPPPSIPGSKTKFKVRVNTFGGGGPGKLSSEDSFALRETKPGGLGIAAATQPALLETSAPDVPN
eukprot:TRINITY_DN10994_c0_g1_i1.p3 TRINITY_DN10994_c0_g1~~TRINITY_DN10994_c0_g1_i1.p3  ORF type:complete len:100 (+),score=19.66 TRINITY_DN10994_c0_g1_i1:105-404(+)